jgi:hypothetical protein
MQDFTGFLISCHVTDHDSLFWQHIYEMVPLFVTQNQAILVQYELACVPDCFM